MNKLIKIKKFNLSTLELDSIPAPRIKPIESLKDNLNDKGWRLPRNIDQKLTDSLPNHPAYTRLIDSINPILAEGYVILVVSQDRGYCNSGRKIITIPTWVIKKNNLQEITWYISHELAHAYDKCLHLHGKEFMNWLIKICPSDSIHFELGYKPRNAKAAGIGQSKVDMFKLLEL
jgi:predicted metal-dependent hydrolase